MKANEQRKLLFHCGRVFSPATPISTQNLFAGRTRQIELVGEAVHTRGQHAIIFGERGVGKTSLANILGFMLQDESTIVAKVNCTNEDSFAKTWKNALSEIDVSEEQASPGFKPSQLVIVRSAAEAINDNSGPEDLRRILQPLSKNIAIVIVFDEFDRLAEGRVQRLFADTIKNFSDHSVNTTLVIVGVANDVSGLIKEHSSVDRCLVQIPMPRMSLTELKEIIDRAMQQLGMSIEASASELLVILSQGLPHYTHLLGKEAALVTLRDSRKRIRMADARAGVNAAIEKAQQSILDAYQNAIRGQRKGTLFSQALLACALAEVDEQGYFVSAAVREPFSKIMGKNYEIPGFSQHLDKFSSDRDRGPVLEKAGTSRRFRFRFKNPLLQPYVIMRGLADEMLVGELLELLQRKKGS